MASLLPVASSDVPPDLMCPLCRDIAIEPVVLALASKTTSVCQHFFCKSCEQSNTRHRLKRQPDIECPFCMKKYETVLPDNDIASKVKAYVLENPNILNGKTYEEVASTRRLSFPIKTQILTAIARNQIDRIDGLANTIEDENERNRILFNLVVIQLKNGKIDIAKKLVSLISRISLAKLGESLIFATYMSNPAEAVNYVMSIQNNILRKSLLIQLISLFNLISSPKAGQFLVSIGLPKKNTPLTSMDETQRKAVASLIPKLIQTAKTLPASDSIKESFLLEIAEVNYHFRQGNHTKADTCLRQAKARCDTLSTEFERCEILILIANQLALTTNNAVEWIVEEMEKQLRNVKTQNKTSPILINQLISTIFTLFHLLKNPKMMERYARQLSETPTRTAEAVAELRDIARSEESSSSAAAASSASHRAEELEELQYLEKKADRDLSPCIVNNHALFLTAKQYRKNGQLHDALRIFSHLYQLPEFELIVPNSEINLRTNIEIQIHKIFFNEGDHYDLDTCNEIVRRFPSHPSAKDFQSIANLTSTLKSRAETAELGCLSKEVITMYKVTASVYIITGITGLSLSILYRWFFGSTTSN